MAKKDQNNWQEKDLSFADAIKWDVVSEGSEFIGRLLKIEEAGRENNRLMTLESDAAKDERFAVWETAQLKPLFDDCESFLANPDGRELFIKLIYQGKAKMASGRTAHQFQVFTRY